jgi:hypothetical protein
MIRTIFSVALFLCVIPITYADSAPTTQPAATQPVIDPVADRILHEACDFLSQTKAFAVHAEVWKDQVLPSGHKVQMTRSVEIQLRRPDRLYVDARAHHKGRSIWYDGKSVTVMDRELGLYGVADAPGSIDETVEMLADKYGVSVPLEDLTAADPYSDLLKHVTAGGYFGDEPVLGVPCRHIAFSTNRIDWQLWVANGPQPLPQKMVIDYKNEEGSPQFIAIFSKWNMSGRASDLAFQFIPPPNSSQIPLESVSEKK